MALFLAVLLAGVAKAAEPVPTCSNKPMVVKIHADWCGSCRATETVWEKIVNDLAEQATAIKFDVSDRVAHRASEAESRRLGIGDFFQEFERRTGSIVVLDCNSKRPLVILGGERDFDKYVEAIRMANRPS